MADADSPVFTNLDPSSLIEAVDPGLPTGPSTVETSGDSPGEVTATFVDFNPAFAGTGASFSIPQGAPQSFSDDSLVAAIAAIDEKLRRPIGINDRAVLEQRRRELGAVRLLEQGVDPQSAILPAVIAAAGGLLAVLQAINAGLKANRTCAIGVENSTDRALGNSGIAVTEGTYNASDWTFGVPAGETGTFASEKLVGFAGTAGLLSYRISGTNGARMFVLWRVPGLQGVDENGYHVGFYRSPGATINEFDRYRSQLANATGVRGTSTIAVTGANIGLPRLSLKATMTDAPKAELTVQLKGTV